MPPLRTCSADLAPSTELPLITLLPRAWIGFGAAPWRCVGLAALILFLAIGPAVVGQDLRQLGLSQLGDLAVLLSLTLPLLPMLALLKFVDELLPNAERRSRPLRWRWLLPQAAALLMLELLLLLGGVALLQTLSWLIGRFNTTLAGLVVILGGLCLVLWMFSQVLALPLLVHRRIGALQAMDHSRVMVSQNGFKVLALLGMLSGLNLLGLLGASLGLLLTLPFSALLLMASCRVQTPCSSVSRRNIFPT